jgi:triacylglycerol lipase
VWGGVVALALLGRVGIPGTLRFSCAGGACCRQFWDDLAAPLPASVGSLCVYTRTDGVVDWRACVDPAGERLEAIGATHCGLIAHPAVLHATATALARFDARRALEFARDPQCLAA